MAKVIKDHWVYWKKKDTIRIVKNRQVVYTLPKDPKKLYDIIAATTLLKDFATTPTQENTDDKDKKGG